MNNLSGRRWARFALALALFVSVVGNVAHTVLAASSISLWLRVPGAVIWPVFTFLAIEIIVRMIWERRWTHNIGRNILLLPAIPAAITSYQHLYSLLLMMGEEQFIAWIGPAAIDGMMIGCTMVLLFTRPGMTPPPIDLDEVLTRYGIDEDQDWDVAAQIELGQSMIADAPVSPAPVSAPPATRTPRAAWDARKVAELAVDGEKTQTIMDATGVSRPTADRFRKVAKMLQANPRVPVDPATEKIRPEYVAIIRELVGR